MAEGSCKVGVLSRRRPPFGLKYGDDHQAACRADGTQVSLDGFIDGGLINLAVVFCLLGVILWILAKESLSKLSELVTVFGA